MKQREGYKNQKGQFGGKWLKKYNQKIGNVSMRGLLKEDLECIDPYQPSIRMSKFRLGE